MKDIDFDELDKAVNSLMSNVGKETLPEKTDDDDVRTVTIPSTLDNGGDDGGDTTSAVTSTDTSAPADTGESAKPISSVAAPSVATRRGGRFMDVVHPSSDMKTAAVTPNPASRRGVTIAPSTSVVSDAPAAESPAPAPESTPTPQVSEPEPTAHHSDWPDPIDLHEASQPAPAPETPASAEPVEEPIAPVEEPAAVPEVVEPAPLTSPFLADAKVEKRPLGGAPASADVTEETKPDTTLEPKLDADADPKQEEPEPAEPALNQADTKTTEPAQSLPPELQGDLVAIESDPSAAHDGGKDSDEKLDEADNSKAETEPAVAPAPSGPASIPQQYKEEPSTGDQENGAIYDTETYHQPLAHPAKKKSGWLWIIWIIIILVLGAGGGAAVYFLGLI